MSNFLHIDPIGEKDEDQVVRPSRHRCMNLQFNQDKIRYGISAAVGGIDHIFLQEK